MELTCKIKDTGTMTRRCLLYTLRNVDNLMVMLFLPVAMLILFVFVLGGAIETGAENYVTYAVPGILLLTIGYGAGTTALSINMDMKNGIIDRFKTMPIGRTAILTGHILASVIKNLVSTILVLGTAFLIGFRPTADIAQWFGFFVMVLLYTLAMTWLALAFGLFAKTPEGAGAFSFIILFLPYCSSGFVPIDSMPKVLRVFAEYQPLTPINESIRALLLGVGGEYYMAAVLWCVGLIVFGYAVSLLIFNKKVS